MAHESSANRDTAITSEASLESVVGETITTGAELTAHTGVAVAHHSNAGDHVQGTDLSLDAGGVNPITAAQAVAAAGLAASALQAGDASAEVAADITAHGAITSSIHGITAVGETLTTAATVAAAQTALGLKTRWLNMSSVSPTGTQADLVCNYKFDGSLADDMGNLGPMVLQAGATRYMQHSTGLVGAAFEATSWYEVAGDASYRLTGAMSFQVIFDSVVGSSRPIFGCYGPGVAEVDNQLYSLWFGANGLRIYNSQHGAYVNDTVYTGSMGISGLMMHTFCRDASGDWLLYSWDSPAYGTPSALVAGTSPTGGAAATLKVGAAHDGVGASTLKFYGSFYGLRIFNVFLTQAQVTATVDQVRGLC